MLYVCLSFLHPLRQKVALLRIAKLSLVPIKFIVVTTAQILHIDGVVIFARIKLLNSVFHIICL